MSFSTKIKAPQFSEHKLPKRSVSPLARVLAAGMLFFSVLVPSRLAAATAGTVVPILGQPAALAYDSSHQLLFISNTSQNRVEVYSVGQGQLLTPIQTGRAPIGVAVSRETNLLVVSNSGDDFLTLIDLNTLLPAGNVTIPPQFITNPPIPETGFSVAATANGLALISTNFGVQGLNLNSRSFFPVRSGQFLIPPNSALAAAQDGNSVLGSGTNAAFVYSPAQLSFSPSRRAPATRVLAANSNGSRFMMADAAFDGALFQTGALNPLTAPGVVLGGIAFSPDGQRVYAGYNQNPGAIGVFASDDLRLLSSFRLAEAVNGPMAITPDGSRLFAITTSGITVVDLNSVAASPSMQVSKKLLFFAFQSCNVGPASQTIQITNASAGTFSWKATVTGPLVTLDTTSGDGPGAIRITVDPTNVQSRGSFVAGTIRISSNESINGDQTIIVTANIANPDQVGAIFPVDGYVSDILVDDLRHRVYLANTTKNQVEVFLTSQRTFATAVPVGSIPKSLAFSNDKKQILVTNLGAEYISTIDADTLSPRASINIPVPAAPISTQPTPAPGTHPLGIATTANGSILFTASTLAEPLSGTVYHLDPGSGSPVAFPNLGTLPTGTVANVTNGLSFLTSTGNRALLFLAQGVGMHLYDSSTGNFAIVRAASNAIVGNVAASADGSAYHANTDVLSSVLTTRGAIPSTTTGNLAGFAFSPIGSTGYRSIRPTSTVPNAILPAPRIEKVDTSSLQLVSSFNIAENLAPPAGSPLFSIAHQLAVDDAEVTLYGVSDSGLLVIPLTATSSTSGPQISPGGVVNGASFALAPAPVSPGSIASIFGTNLATGISAPSALPLPVVLGGACVTFDGVAAPFFFVSPTQMNVQVPWEVSGKSTVQVAVGVGALSSQPITVNLAPVAPAIFTTAGNGRGPGAILHSSDFSLVTAANPATVGETVSIFVTGLGVVDTVIPTGSPAPTDGTLVRSAVPTVSIGGVNAPVAFAGLAPGFVGLYQVDVRLPSNTPIGTSVPVVVTLGARQSNAATIAVLPPR